MNEENMNVCMTVFFAFILNFLHFEHNLWRVFLAFCYHSCWPVNIIRSLKNSSYLLIIYCCILRLNHTLVYFSVQTLPSFSDEWLFCLVIQGVSTRSVSWHIWWSAIT